MGEAAVQIALLAATRDREAAQAALAEAKTRQDETAEVTCSPVEGMLLMLRQLSTYQNIPIVSVNAPGAVAGAKLVHERASAAAEGEE